MYQTNNVLTLRMCGQTSQHVTTFFQFQNLAYLEGIHNFYFSFNFDAVFFFQVTCGQRSVTLTTHFLCRLEG